MIIYWDLMKGDVPVGGSTDPGESNVRSGTAYTISGVGKTGTLVVPSLANTKIGVAGDGGTGTYDGSDRWTDPTEAAVQIGVAYKANSTTNNKTGTYDGSDRWTDPGIANVKIGTTYKANSTSVNNTGTYDGSDRWTDPGIANVLSGVAYKANSTTNNRTGTLSPTGGSVTNLISSAEVDGLFDGAITEGSLMSITITQGDAVTIALTATRSSSGSVHDLTGATFETKFLKSDNTELIIANSAHAITVAASGTYTVALTATESATLMSGTHLDIVSKVTQGSGIIHFHGKGVLNVLRNVLYP